MERKELIKALRQMGVQTGGLMCVGCGAELTGWWDAKKAEVHDEVRRDGVQGTGGTAALNVPA